jgi:hypothetical protein
MVQKTHPGKTCAQVHKGLTHSEWEKKWFQRAVKAKAPYTLGGWSKSKSTATRRRLALSSRPKTWTLKRKRLSTARALQALANVSKDKATRSKAESDATYFYKLRRK